MKTEVITSSIKWLEKHNQQLIIAALLSIIITMPSVQLYHIYDEISHYNAASALDSPASTPTSSEKKLNLDDFQLLFGSSNRPEVQGKPSDIPITKLNLILNGSLSGLQKESKSSAIIQGNNQAKVYQVGDTLPGGAILTEVHADHVLLKRNGQPEILSFPDKDKESKGLNLVNQQKKGFQPELRTGSDYTTKQPDNDSLEERMRKLKEQLQQASQGSS